MPAVVIAGLLRAPSQVSTFSGYAATMVDEIYTAFDTETTGLHPYHGDCPFAFQTCDEEWNVEVYRKDVNILSFNRRLRELWNDSSIKVMHNAKFDLAMTRIEGVTIPDFTTIHDTMIMAIVLRNNESSALKKLTKTYAGFPDDDEKEIKKFLRGGKTDYSRVPRHIMDEYAGADVERTMICFKCFWPIIQSNTAFLAEYLMELDLIWPVMSMEREGLMINPRQAQSLIAELKDTSAELQSRYPDIDLGKDRQVAHHLFSRLKMPVKKRTEKGEPSTRKDILAELNEEFPECEFINDVLAYRSYSRGATMIDSYMQKMDAQCIIHPTINPNGAKATCRMSCEDPNLQNVQKKGKLLNKYPVLARKCFRPEPGSVNFSKDYAGIEMRLLVMASKDPELMEILHTTGKLHEHSAEVFYQERYTECTDATEKKILRDAAKNGGFTIAYGGGIDKVAKTLQLTYAEGEAARDRYKQRHPTFVSLMADMTRAAKKQGYIDTAFGRRLYIESNHPYVAINYYIQGTAAGILKRGIIAAYRWLKKNAPQWRIRLPVHDELIFTCPRSELSTAREVLANVRLCMITMPECITVPLETECEIVTTNWNEPNKYELQGVTS